MVISIASNAQDDTKCQEPCVSSQEVDITCALGIYEVHITSKAELDSLLKLCEGRVLKDCQKKYPIPNIDFKKYDLIGWGSSSSGCNAPDVNVKLVQTGKKLEVHLAVTNITRCRMVFSLIKWYKIPKRPSGTTVEFIVTREAAGK